MKKIFYKLILKFSFTLFFSFVADAAEIQILSNIAGTGPKIVNHSKVSVHYRGTLNLKIFSFEIMFKSLY